MACCNLGALEAFEPGADGLIENNTKPCTLAYPAHRECGFRNMAREGLSHRRMLQLETVGVWCKLENDERCQSV